ncbi:hypothetical protein HanIR_Chr03g0118031 [Helianthus annuus]|nr:hypothetical protein HanIR_Chr03g0118031 [Helianthus annuus]
MCNKGIFKPIFFFYYYYWKTYFNLEKWIKQATVFTLRITTTGVILSTQHQPQTYNTHTAYNSFQQPKHLNIRHTPASTMASIQILKSGLHPFSSLQSSSHTIKPLIPNDSIRTLKFSSKLQINRRFIVSCKAKDADDNEIKGEEREPTESLFMKELKRRGMSRTSLLEKEEEEDIEEKLSNQRERSLALNSEGLEGLIPRAKVLVTLGGTFFLAFWPLILVTVASFSGLYLYFGPKFVHDATTRPVHLPQYIDPYDLLEDERISETAPRLN